MIKILQKILNNNHTLVLLSTGINTFFIGLGFLLYVRTYSKEDIGQWIIYLAGQQLLDRFRSGLLFTALIKFLSGNRHKDDSEEIIGSTWILSFISTFLIILFFYLIFFIFQSIIIQKGFLLFFQLFPVSFIALLPISISISILASRGKFGKILFIRIGSVLPQMVFLFLNYFIFRLNIFTVTLISIFISFPIVIYCIADGSSGIKYILKASKKILMKILNYGKYSMLTMLAANLLSSSNVFIIGLFLTNVDVANYGVPSKIIIILESILNSFCDVAMPAISKEANLNNIPAIRQLFYKYSGFVTILIVPIIILFILFANFFLWIIGGSKYLDNPEIYCVLFIFVLSFLIHPVDRFTGITLDSINKPGLNLFKVLIMVSINIIGDIIVIIIFKSITSVALITLLNVISGAIIGVFLIKKQIGIRFVDFYFSLVTEIKFFLKFVIEKINVLIGK